jgi:hypothetical protein
MNVNLVTRLAVRFDVRGEDFEVDNYFPCVTKRNGVATESAVLFRLKYSSKPVQGIVYKNHPLADGNCWHIQEKLCYEDQDTAKSVIAALELAGAAPNSYLSTDFPPNRKLTGCSLGLTVVACVLGMPGCFAYTGWVSAYGRDTGRFPVGQVEGTATKIAFCKAKQLPLFVARRNLMTETATAEKCAFARYYQFKDFALGLPYSSDIFEAIECVSIADVLLLGYAIYVQRQPPNVIGALLNCEKPVIVHNSDSIKRPRVESSEEESDE